MPARTALALAFVAVLPGLSLAATPPHTGAELTLYRSDSAALYAASGTGSVDEGHAVVREQRPLTLTAGSQQIVLDDLPQYLDAEAAMLAFPDDRATVLWQQLRLSQGTDDALIGLTGHRVEVLGGSGQSLASGTLLHAGDGLLVRDTDGGTTLVRDYAAVRSQNADFASGANLSLRVDAKRAGLTTATLSYPTGGMGWRAAYLATLQPGNGCHMQFQARASIANRSGRDWNGARLTLVAGEPNFAKASAPRPMMARAYSAKADSGMALPEQATLADYRMFRLPRPLDLLDGSVSQVPLYAARTLTCQRVALYESGNAWTPPQPMLARDFNNAGSEDISSILRFKAFDSLPAGYLRVLTHDRQGTPQFIGEGRIEDTPKGADATLVLGTAFDLRAQRERTAFKLDPAAHTMDEAFRITLSNTGEAARTVTVREHPSRWHEWTLVSSSSRPVKQSPDGLEFHIKVPAGGQATLDYAVRYQWSAEQEGR